MRTSDNTHVGTYGFRLFTTPAAQRFSYALGQTVSNGVPAAGAGNLEAVSTTLGWRLVNSRMPAEWTVSLGEANEQLQERYGVSRERQDAFAARSHDLADRAWKAGFYDDLVLPVEGLDRDECVRPDASLDALAGLKPAFRPDGTITAGNASPLNDGAAAVLVAAEGAAVGVPPLARIAGRGAAALEPQRFGIAPVEAADRALAAAGITWSDVGAVELQGVAHADHLAALGRMPQAEVADLVKALG